MAFTQAQIDAFEQALVDRKGAQAITFGDQTVQFATYQEALTFLAHMKRNVAAPPPRTRYAVVSKGA